MRFKKYYSTHITIINRAHIKARVYYSYITNSLVACRLTISVFEVIKALLTYLLILPVNKGGILGYRNTSYGQQWTKKFQKKKKGRKKRKILDSKTSSLTRRRRRHKVSLSLLAVLYIYTRAHKKRFFEEDEERPSFYEFLRRRRRRKHRHPDLFFSFGVLCDWICVVVCFQIASS